MSNITFEYCSLAYLNQWLMYDRRYCWAFDHGDREQQTKMLKEASTIYSVARNAPLDFDVKATPKRQRFAAILDIFDSKKSIYFKDDTVRKVNEVAKAISKEYGGKKVISLTTKFLWFKFKSPIHIYDSRAKAALNVDNDDLVIYYARWEKEFKEYKKHIEAAAKRLPEIHRYAVDQQIGTKEYIKEISREAWFHERIFDMYLWERGTKSERPQRESTLGE